MDMETINDIKMVAEVIIVYGGAASVVGYALLHLYRAIRNIEKIRESTDLNYKEQQETRKELRDHVRKEEAMDDVRDEKLAVILAEMRPNGGSSIKDVVNDTQRKINEIHTRVSVLEQWKEDSQHPENLHHQ